MPEFSIIIPFVAENDYLRETLEALGRQAYRNFEIILLPDISNSLQFSTSIEDIVIQIIPTGNVGPAIKRDLGAEKAAGMILAFIDDDAYPDPDWLENAARVFADHPDFVAVGGPAITPESDSFWAKVSGAVFLSKLSGGFPERYRPEKPGRLVEDWPSVNLLVRREAFLKVGGFDSAFWPGEDTKLCHDLVTQTAGKIWYEPELIVWHHRRASLRKHLRQVGNYGLHRGFFMKKFPATSLRPAFLMPLLFAIYLALTLLGWAAAAAGVIPVAYAGFFSAGWAVYGAAMLLALRDMLKSTGFAVAIAALPYVFITHLYYGVCTAKGLVTKELHSSLGR